MERRFGKAIALLVTLLMIDSAMVAMIPSIKATTTATKTDVPEGIVLVGQKNVVVMKFTVTENGTDVLLNGTTPLIGIVGDTSNPWSNILFYDDGDNTWESDSDAIWLDNNGSGKYERSTDTLLAGTEPDDETEGNTLNPWSNILFYDDGDNTWESNSDAIWKDDGNTAYGDAITGITVSNAGTASNRSDISQLTLYMEDGTTSGFQVSEDTLVGTFTYLGHGPETWTCDLSASPITLFNEIKTFYVVADISKTSTAGKTLKFKISATDINVNSTDDVPSVDLINAYNITIGGKLGVDYFEGTEKGAVDVIKTNTKELKYGATVDIKINTSVLTNGKVYYLYYPYYKRTGSGGSYTYEIEWRPYIIAGGSEQARIVADGTVKGFAQSIKFDVSGMWMLIPEGHTPDEAISGAFNDYAYFWVNGTEAYNMDLSATEVYYGKNESITITVTEGGSAAGVWIDVRKESDNSLVFHKWAGSGVLTFNSDWLHNLTYAGNYTVFAYRDIDETVIGYGSEGYSKNYGYTDPSITGTNYSGLCGPWDPPEKTSKVAKIIVKTGKPTLEIPETNKTMYWSFPGEVKIYTTGYDGKNLTFNGADVKVYNSDKDEVTSHLTINTGTGVIKIRSNSWGKDGTVWGRNGTWYAVIANDIDGDGIEEWNGTVKWTVTKAPGLQIQITDPEDKEISEVPNKASQPISIKFKVVNRDHEYLGDGTLDEDMKNITISGDALFIGEDGKTLYDYNKMFTNAVTYNSANHEWTVKLTPIMDLNGGEITISVDWGSWGTAEDKIMIGGTKLNGTVVMITPSEFTIGENVTLTVRVTDAKGFAYPNAYVALYYVDDTGKLAYMINETNGGGTTSGKYTFLFNVTQQTDKQLNVWSEIKAPRYIAAYVYLANVGYGYAYATMKPKSDLKVEISNDKLMAGKKYDLWINVSTVDPLTGNKIGTPEDTGLHVKIYNETGKDVTSKFGGWGWSSLDGDATIELTSVYALEPGTYTIYAYNNTHNSERFNATIKVIPVEVSFDKKELIWKYDENITVTFTVKWQGLPVNGTLKIFGISDEGKYNKTWVNNSSITVEVLNGIAVVHNITANNLSENSIENITFQFQPEVSGSEFANATGELPVRVPHITAEPDKVALNEMASIEIKATGRGVGLEGYNITIKGPGNLNLTAQTDAEGIARFSFLPTATGNIDIYVENRLVDTKIEITSHRLKIDAPAQVYEDEEFTVKVTDENGSPVEGVTVTFSGTTKLTNANGEVKFKGTVFGNLPYVTYTITARKSGYLTAQKDITIINVPQLYIYINPVNVSSGQKFTVKVTSDAGPVYGVHVEVKDPTGKVVADGTITVPEGVTLTAPTVNKETKFTVTVSKEGYKSATAEITVKPGGIPGFELVTLIAAIGVAFILLRKRRQ